MGPIKTAQQINHQRMLENIAKINFAKGAKQMERWFAYNEDPGNICPICDELDALGWVDFGLLPPFKKAHSIIGEGKWNAPDSSCQCAKGYKRVTGKIPKNIIPISGYDGPNSIADPRLNFEIKYSRDEVIEKIKLMKQKYSKCNCK
jgi:hypothetical protein